MCDGSTGRGGASTDDHDGCDGAAAEASDEAVVVLRLLLHPGEPLSGSVALGQHATPIAFCGWIDFMAAVNGLRNENPVRKAKKSGIS